MFEEWMVAAFGDAPSLALASGGVLSVASIYGWRDSKNWPGGDAMIVLHRLGCNVLRFGDPTLPMFSDTVEGQAQARKAGSAAGETPAAGSSDRAKKGAEDGGANWMFLGAGPEDPGVANLSDPVDLLAFIAERVTNVRTAVDRELDALSALARRRSQE
jgi:hypothetical protein